MTLAEFNVLPHARQIAHVFVRGKLLATRWPEENRAVNLYDMAGPFFAELTYDLTTNRIVGVRAFDSRNLSLLGDYVGGVQLPGWVPGSE